MLPAGPEPWSVQLVRLQLKGYGSLQGGGGGAAALGPGAQVGPPLLPAARARAALAAWAGTPPEVCTDTSTTLQLPVPAPPLQASSGGREQGGAAGAGGPAQPEASAASGSRPPAESSTPSGSAGPIWLPVVAAQAALVLALLAALLALLRQRRQLAEELRKALGSRPQPPSSSSGGGGGGGARPLAAGSTAAAAAAPLPKLRRASGPGPQLAHDWDGLVLLGGSPRDQEAERADGWWSGSGAAAAQRGGCGPGSAHPSASAPLPRLPPSAGGEAGAAPLGERSGRRRSTGCAVEELPGAAGVSGAWARVPSLLLLLVPALVPWLGGRRGADSCAPFAAPTARTARIATPHPAPPRPLRSHPICPPCPTRSTLCIQQHIARGRNE
jgi:hypothetical protein